MWSETASRVRPRGLITNVNFQYTQPEGAYGPLPFRNSCAGPENFRCFICGRMQFHRTSTIRNCINLRTWRHREAPGVYMCRFKEPNAVNPMLWVTPCAHRWHESWPDCPKHVRARALMKVIWNCPLSARPDICLNIIDFLFDVPIPAPWEFSQREELSDGELAESSIYESAQRQRQWRAQFYSP